MLSLLIMQIDFWELSSGDKLKVLLELLDAAMGTTRIRDYLEMKVRSFLHVPLKLHGVSVSMVKHAD